MINIIIVDDDPLVVCSLKTIIESSGNIKVLEVGSSGKEAVDLYVKYKPDVLLMDIRMAIMTGIEAAEIILKRFSDAKILFLTTFLDDEYIMKALKLGAKGYILKQYFDKLIPAIEAVNDGHNVFGSEIMSKIPEVIGAGDKKTPESFGLSDKELDIIVLVSEGMSNKEISDELYLGEGTVRNYISVILNKLCLRDRTQLAVFYYKNFK